MNMGAFGFWLFLTAVVIGSVWWATTKRKTRQAALNALISKGESVDPRIIEGVLQDTKPGPSRLDVWLMVIGLVILFSGVGLLAMTPFIDQLDAEAKLGALAAGACTTLSSLGFILGSVFVRRRSNDVTGVKQD